MVKKAITLRKNKDSVYEFTPKLREKTNNNELMPAKLIHNTLAFKREGVLLGFRMLTEGKSGIEEQPFHIIGDEKGLRIELGKRFIILNQTKYLIDESYSPPLLEDRWDFERVLYFVGNPGLAAGLYDRIKDTLHGFMDLQNPAQYGLITVWIIATYFAQLFPAFPFLSFYGPKESGKSKILEILSLIAFNGIKVKTITEPALCDTAEGLRGTILIDQAETLPLNMVGILADSYKKAGAKRRIIGSSNGKRIVKEFSGYCPKAFASTKNLDPDLSDRCCQISMLRSQKSLPDIIGCEPEWSEIRELCYQYLLLKWQEVAETIKEIPHTGDRKGELWRPLETILRATQVSDQEREEIRNAFDQGIDKTKNKLTNTEAALFQVLLDKAEHRKKFEMTTYEIISDMEPYLEKCELPTPQGLGNMIDLFSLAESKKRKSRKKIIHYLFAAERIKDLASRYVE